MAFWTKFNKNRTWSSVKNIRIWGFGLATCRYIRNAPIFCDHCFLKIWTRCNGMPRNLGDKRVFHSLSDKRMQIVYSRSDARNNNMKNDQINRLGEIIFTKILS